MNIMPVAMPIQVPGTTQTPQSQGSGSFGELLNNAINQLNDSQVKADDIMQQFMVGDVQDIHQVTIAMQEAELTMQLAVQVRDKIVEAYQEISRMQL